MAEELESSFKIPPVLFPVPPNFRSKSFGFDFAPRPSSSLTNFKSEQEIPGLNLIRDSEPSLSSLATLNSNSGSILNVHDQWQPPVPANSEVQTRAQARFCLEKRFKSSGSMCFHNTSESLSDIARTTSLPLSVSAPTCDHGTPSLPASVPEPQAEPVSLLSRLSGPIPNAFKANPRSRSRSRTRVSQSNPFDTSASLASIPQAGATSSLLTSASVGTINLNSLGSMKSILATSGSQIQIGSILNPNSGSSSQGADLNGFGLRLGSSESIPGLDSQNTVLLICLVGSGSKGDVAVDAAKDVETSSIPEEAKPTCSNIKPKPVGEDKWKAIPQYGDYMAKIRLREEALMVARRRAFAVGGRRRGGFGRR